jgi:hypothetical protein
MAWPLSQDYNEAIQSAAANFADPDLRRGAAVVNDLGLPMPFSGNFADVYQVACPDGSRWAVKCFTREVPRLRERYQEISKFLGQARLPFTVDFSFHQEGIRVAGRWYPVLKMQWVEGFTLNQFVGRFLDKPTMLEALLRLWTRMAKYLRAAGAAHCDLQHGNVLLVPGANSNSLALKLIDYDGMYVPALARSKSGEVGHPSYQHPQRLREGTYNLEVDRFPLLVIATALSALSVEGRPLWEKYDNADNLLFRETDLRDPARSELFRDLSKLDDPTTAALADAVCMALKSNLEAAPLLNEVLAEAVPTPSVAVAVVPEKTSAVPAISTPSDEGIWGFSESIVSVSALRPSRLRTRKKKVTRKAKPSGIPRAIWVGGAAAAAFILLGGGALLAFALLWNTGHPTGPGKPGAENKAKTERKNGPGGNDKLADEAKTGFVGDVKISEEGRYELDKNLLFDEGRRVALTPDNKHLLIISGAKLGYWRFGEPRLAPLTDPRSGRPHCVSVDPTGCYAAVGTWKGNIEIWDLNDLKLKTTLDIAGSDEKPAESTVPVFAVAFTPDGKRLLSAGPDPNVHQWDLEKGVEVGEALRTVGKLGWQSALAVSPDGLHYAIGTYSGIVRVMRLDGNKQIAQFIGPTGPTKCVVVAPDNKHAVSSSETGSASVWEMQTGKELVAFQKHTGSVNAVAVSPDGRWVFSGGEDQFLRLWELESGRELGRCPGHKSAVTSVGFFKDGRHTFSCGKDNVLRIWRLQPADSPSPPSLDLGPSDTTATSPSPETKPGPIVNKTDNRLPVPDAAALAAAEKEVKEAYEPDNDKPEPSDVRRLYSRLCVDGSNESDKSAAFRYVLLRKARDLAARSGDHYWAILAVEALARIFDVDVWEMKADVLEEVAGKPAKAHHQNLSWISLTAADEAIDEDAFASAERLLKVAQTTAAATGKHNLKGHVAERLKELAVLRKAYERVVRDA